MTTQSLTLSTKGIILKNSFWAAAVGVPGAFAAHADIPILAGIWAKMIYEIAEDNNIELNEANAIKIAAAIGGAVGIAAVGVKAANTYFAYTGIGSLLAIPLNATANGVGTYLIGDTSAKLINKKELTPADYARAVLGVLSGWLGTQINVDYDDIKPSEVKSRFDL